MLISGTGASLNRFPLFGAHGAVSGTVGPCDVVFVLPDSRVQPAQRAFRTAINCPCTRFVDSLIMIRKMMRILYKEAFVLMSLRRIDTDLTGSATENEGCTRKDLDISDQSTGPVGKGTCTAGCTMATQ